MPWLCTPFISRQDLHQISQLVGSVGLSIAWFVHQASNRLWMSTGRSYNPFFNYPFAHTHTRRHVSAHLPNPIQFLSSFSQTDEHTQCVAVVVVIVFGRLGITQSSTEVHYGNRILIARKLLPRALFCNLIIVLCLSVRLSAFYSSKTWTWHIKHRTQDRQTISLQSDIQVVRSGCECEGFLEFSPFVFIFHDR